MKTTVPLVAAMLVLMAAAGCETQVTSMAGPAPAKTETAETSPAAEAPATAEAPPVAEAPPPAEAAPDAETRAAATPVEAKPETVNSEKPESAGESKAAPGDAEQVVLAGDAKPASAGKGTYDPIAAARKFTSQMKVKPTDSASWGISPLRNNVSDAKKIPVTWDGEQGTNVKWSALLGSQTYGNPVIANGQVYVGTNNGAGYIKRYPSKVDLGVLVCFSEADGKFLWQHSSEKLPTGRVHDWPLQGICSAPMIDGERGWYVTSRGEIVCFDTQGFHDKENDGPFTSEKPDKPDVVWEEEKECDVLWKVDMMKQLNVSQHNMCSCSVTGVGDYLFVITSNGVDEAHINIPSPEAPSFLCLNRDTGKILWQDNSPGNNVLHGQWSSPAYGVFNGQAQVMFPGGDGWIYAFDPKGDNGKSKLLWKFDCNPKTSHYALQRATRNHLIGTPCIYDGKVYIGVGEDPEHGEGEGHLWCINPVNKGGDVSPTLVYNKADPTKVLPVRRLKASLPDEGDFEKDNPNSAAVWHYAGKNPESDEFTDVFHRTIGSCAIKDDLLYVADFSGCFHCLDAKTGKVHWVFDMLAASWGSPLIVDDKVYIGDEDGDIHIFQHSKELKAIGNDGMVAEDPTSVTASKMPTSVYTSPVVANGVLFISDKLTLYAIAEGAKSEPAKPRSIEAGDSE